MGCATATTERRSSPASRPARRARTSKVFPSSTRSPTRCTRPARTRRSSSCRHEDERRVRAGLVHRVGDRVEDGNTFDVLALLAGRDAGDDLRSVVAVAQPMEATLAAGQPLDDEARVVVDDDRHYFCDRRALTTIDFSVSTPFSTLS